MAWYRTGTVTVTNGSSAVTGSGTLFVENVIVGDAFNGPDGRRYEIINVASNTSLAIRPNYIGSTAAGQAYSTEPTGDWTKALAADVRALITTWQGAAEQATGSLQKSQNLGDVSSKSAARANLELGPLASIVAGSSAAEKLAARNVLALGRIAAIVSSSGSSDKKNAQMDLGVISSVVDEVFNTGNCTVVTTPTGTSWRHPTGLQICIVEDTAGGAWVDVPEGACWRSIGLSWTYPQEFVAVPSVVFNTSSQSSAGAWVGGGASSNTATRAFFIAWCAYQIAQSVKISGVAIGRWK